MKKILILTTSLFAFYQTSAIAAAPYPQYEALVEKHAALQRLDKNIVWAVMGRESSGDRFAISNKNARGLLQVIPPTAARMGVNPKHLYDPEQNIIAGTRYLRFLCNHFPDRSSIHGCNLDLVLAGYNAGEGAVRKYGGDSAISGNSTLRSQCERTICAFKWQPYSFGIKSCSTFQVETYTCCCSPRQLV